MKIKNKLIKLALLYACLLCLDNTVYAQGIVNVNTLTGTASAVIPIYTVQSGQVSVPISVAYSATGVRPKDVESTAGMNWQLQAGGQISRQVRGLPDDIAQDNAIPSHPLIGWMSSSNTYPTYISNFPVQNDGSNSTCTDEAADISYINNYFPINTDSEPDVFYVNAPGLSCQMVYDKGSTQFKLINYQDLKISYTLNGNYLLTFSITNDKGVTYTFGNANWVTQITNGGSHNYFKTKYTQYQYGVSYSDTWYLTSITDAAGNAVNLTYNTAQARSGSDPVSLYFSGLTTAQLQYTMVTTTTPAVLASIYATNVNAPSQHTTATFTWLTTQGFGASGGTPGTGQTIIQTINVPGHVYRFGYDMVQYGASYYRYFLSSFADDGCSSPINFKFTYAGETITGSTYTTALPDSNSKQVDYWGYYAANGNPALIPKIMMAPSNTAYSSNVIFQSAPYTAGSYAYVSNGNSRVADPTNVMMGSLNKITYPEGGSTTIVYESNDYVDVPSNLVVQGGGIRAKQVIDNDNITGISITRNYSYINPNTTISSGKPITLPVFSFILPYYGGATGQTLWTYGTALSDYDLSAEDHTIMYEYAKVSLTGGGGSTLYQYSVPATNWDAAASPACNSCGTEWHPTINYSARDNCTPYSWMVSNAANSYPFIPNPNYDFERGLPLKIKAYSNTNSLASETDYTYSRLSSPSVITAVKFDDLISNIGTYIVKGYGKYLIYYNTGELTATATKTIYDAANYTQPQTSSVTYSYGSTYHKLYSQQATNSDGSTNTTYIKYIKDFAAVASSTSANLNALYYLQQLNINDPVESYHQVTRGGTTVTTDASLALFNAYTVGSTTHYLPSQQKKFIQPDGVTDFVPFATSISPQSVTFDWRYNVVANYSFYDNAGYPQTVDDNYKHYKTVITEHSFNNPIAIFANAQYGEVAINDFDSNFPAPLPTFTINGTGSVNATGHTGAAYNLGTGQSLTKTVTKNALAQKYIFSVWLNPTASGTMTIALTNGATSNNNTILLPAAGVWTYREVPIALTGLPGTFTATVTTTGATAIDDVLLYPDVAQVATFAYDPTTHYKTAETNTNGISAYYSSDQWGRLLYQYDQDKNIVLKKAYIKPQNVTDIITPVITYTYSGSSITTSTPVTFSSNVSLDACTNVGLTYTWTFGDGSATVTTTSATAPAHTYTSAGSYTVNLTVNSPFFPPKTAAPVSVTVVAATATVTLANNSKSSGVYTVTLTNSSNSYTFNATTMSGNILPGTYTVTITPFGTSYNSGTGFGWNSIVFADGINGNCYSYATSISSFSWTVAAGDSLTFTGYNNNYCPFN